MKKNPNKKTSRTGHTDHQEKAGKESKEGRTTGKDVNKARGTAYDRLNKALAVHERALEKNPEDAAAWAGKAAVFLRHRMHRDSLKASEPQCFADSTSMKKISKPLRKPLPAIRSLQAHGTQKVLC